MIWTPTLSVARQVLLLCCLPLLFTKVLGQTDDYNPILQPPENAVVQAGSSYDIVWEASAKYGGTATIYLLSGDKVDNLGITATLTKNVSNAAGKFEWAVPSTLGQATMYEFQMVQNSDATIFQYSYPFRISNATLATTTSGSTTQTPAPSRTQQTSASTTAPGQTGGPDQGPSSAPSLAPGSIAGIVIGALVAVAALLFAAWFFFRRRQREKNLRQGHYLPELGGSDEHDRAWRGIDGKPSLGPQGCFELGDGRVVAELQGDVASRDYDSMDGSTARSPESTQSYPLTPQSVKAVSTVQSYVSVEAHDQPQDAKLFIL